MGVSLDTYDEENGIHPRNKQLPSKRLAYAGLNVAYGQDQFPANGPFPQTIDFEATENGIQCSIVYDKAFTWNPIESEGFYYCCEASVDLCNNKGSVWQLLNPGSVTADEQSKAVSFERPLCSIALAYLWETTPVLKTKALPIYAKDEFELPAAPWIKEIN